MICNSVTQPTGNSALRLINGLLTGGGVTQVDIAAAYVTTSGARDLLETLRNSFAARWPAVQKRWLTSFDYCRTEPLAAHMLGREPNSSVRVHDAIRLLRQQCNPTIPFHPKAFLFRGPGRHAVFAGSGNISRSGLSTGYEVGLLIDCRLPGDRQDKQARSTVISVQNWYNSTWNAATPFDAALESQYRGIYDNAANLRHPTPTEDDAVAGRQGRGSLTAEDLRKLRACGHFWIEAGNVTRNRGRRLPGNQLMMKRLSRVFFGVPPTNVPQNSPLTRLEITYGGVAKPDCSLTFSDNGMDKLTLPIPGGGGPPMYDNEILLFTRIEAGIFHLDLGTRAQRRDWLRRSQALRASYTMPPHGRQWGIF
jgi:HKD family nuclease